MWKKITVSFLLIAVALGAFFYDDLQRLRLLNTVFSAESIVNNFRHMDQLFDTVTVHKGDKVSTLEQNFMPLPKAYAWQGQQINIEDFLNQTWTTGFLVLHKNKVVAENYYRGETADDLHIAWSVTKSFVSALVGIAISEGKINSIDDSVDKYVPALSESGYKNVSIRNVLHMASGIAFNEDYGDINSDVNRMGYTLFNGGSLNDVTASLQQQRKDGEFNHYVSANTHVLGMLLESVYQQDLARLLEDKLWKKLGMQANAEFIIDGVGTAMAMGGLNLTLRDYARFGRLYLQNGVFEGEQIVPQQWIADSISTDAAHLKPGVNKKSDSEFGYGFQWWIPKHPRGDYVAIGIYNQFIYIDPKHDMVIVKTSAYPDYLQQWREHETVAMFQQLSSQLAAELELVNN